MHGKDFDINIDNLSKIEGHADLEISIKNKKVQHVKLKISENKRFFTQAVRGKPATGIYQIVSRICGTCSVAHQTACIEAVEKGIGIRPSDQTIALRNLMLYGLNIRDHAMHLYLFCLPDIYGKDSVLEFPDDGPEHELLHDCFDIKAVGNNLGSEIGGRAIHATNTAVGGYMKMPSIDNLKKIAKDLEGIREKTIKLVDIFYKCDFEHQSDSSFVSLINKDFSYLGEELASSTGVCVPEALFGDHLQKVVIPYSQAPGFEFQGKQFIVGAISRMNLNGSKVNRRTRKDLSKYVGVFPSKNLFHNNLAQAIEIVHCIDHSLEIIDGLEIKAEKPNLPLKLEKEVEGIGAIEAPRGTLYYDLRISPDMKINSVNLVIPTSQNQISMEREIGKLVQNCLDAGMGADKIHFEIEKLIRAYDPCMSCATHFLKVKWNKE
ncbi:MAG: nickel-dependent hydrogenase large subunit [Candidatus Micrarchaeia archaeon]|jgi:coenzyme F420-reducing hydrogenase alpha subunit